MLMPRTTKTYATQRVPVPRSEPLFPGNFYWLSFISSVPFWSCFCYWSYFIQFQNARTPQSVLRFAHCLSLFQKRQWVSVWTHRSTVTRSTLRLPTGERWQCVEVNTVCCCWLIYTGMARGIPPLTELLALCGYNHPIGATNHTAKPVNQFQLKINLRCTVERQYCTDLLQIHYKLELGSFHCSY